MESQNKNFSHIISRCQTLNAMVKRLNKLRESLSPDLPGDVRRRRYISIQVAQENLALQEHELHCEMVSLGIADINEDRYGNITLTFQFGPTSLYFRKPGEAGAIPATSAKADMELSPLEMAVEEVKRPEDVDYATTGDEEDEPEDSVDLDEEQYQEDIWYGGDDIAELEAIVARMRFRMDNGLVNKLASFEQKLKVAKQKEGIPEPKPEKAKGKSKAKEAIPESPGMKLSEAVKIWKATGEVPEGFKVISDNLYKKTTTEQQDPDRHVKAMTEEAPPAEAVETPKPGKKKTEKPVEEKAPKAEKSKKEEPDPLVKKDTGEIWSGEKKFGDDLVW